MQYLPSNEILCCDTINLCLEGAIRRSIWKKSDVLLFDAVEDSDRPWIVAVSRPHADSALEVPVLRRLGMIGDVWRHFPMRDAEDGPVSEYDRDGIPLEDLRLDGLPTWTCASLWGANEALKGRLERLIQVLRLLAYFPILNPLGLSIGAIHRCTCSPGRRSGEVAAALHEVAHYVSAACRAELPSELQWAEEMMCPSAKETQFCLEELLKFLSQTEIEIGSADRLDGDFVGSLSKVVDVEQSVFPEAKVGRSVDVLKNWKGMRNVKLVLNRRWIVEECVD